MIQNQGVWQISGEPGVVTKSDKLCFGKVDLSFDIALMVKGMTIIVSL